MRTLIIIPCYNEQENIEAVVERLRQVYPQGDYLVVDDCSTDASGTLLKHNGYSYLQLPVNLGIGGGVQCGYLYAVQHGYDIAVQMDGDGQHDPAYLQTLIDPVAKGELDVSIGSRFITREGFQTSTFRRAGIRVLSGLIRLLTGVKIKDVTSGFRACNSRATAFYAEHYAQDFPEPEAIISGVMNGFQIAEVPVVMEERRAGLSSIGPVKGAYYMIKVGLSLVVYRLIWTRKRRDASC